MKKELNVPAIVLSVFGGITLIVVVAFVYMSLNGPNYTSEYFEKIQSGEIENPIQEFALMFSDDSQEIPEDAKVITIQTEDGEKNLIIQADLGDLSVEDVEEALVNYGAIVLKLYNLHEIPFLGTTPKVQIYIDEKIYNLEIVKGDIFLRNYEINNPDVIIKTTNGEIFKMIENSEYATESVSSGRTSIEMVASKFVLFSKGYLSLYNELNK